MRARGLFAVAALALLARGTAFADTIPAITAQPSNATSALGGSFSFSVTATGSTQLTYQWYQNGVALFGQIEPTYIRSSTQPADTGAYTVKVTDSAGTTTSAAATMTLTPDRPPSLPTNVPFESFETLGMPETLTGFYQYQPQLASEWFKDGQLIPNSYALSYNTPGLASDGGVYVGVLGNDAGAFGLNPITVSIIPATPANPWLAAQTQGGIVYFLFANPAEIQRYDTSTRTWLPTVALNPTPGVTPGPTPTAMEALSEGVYVAFGRTTYLYSLDLSTFQPLTNTAVDMVEMFANGSYVYLAGESDNGGIGTYVAVNRSNPTLLVINQLSAPYTFLSGVAVSSSTGLAYGWGSAGEPTAIGYLTLNSDGSVVATQAFGNSIYGYEFDHSLVVISPDGTKIVSDTGGVFNTAGETPTTSLGLPVTGVCFLADGSPVALRGPKLTLYNASSYADEGSVSISSAAQSVFASGSTVYAFTAPSSPGGTIGVVSATESQLLASPRATLPGLSPSQSAATELSPDQAFIGTDGNAYLLDRALGNILRWSPSQGKYLTSIPLTGIPSGMSYSAELNRIYLSYGDQRITQINLGSSTSETPFTAMNAPIQTMLAASNELYVVTNLIESSGNYEWVASSTGVLTPPGGFSDPDLTPSWNDALGLIFEAGDNLQAASFSVQSGTKVAQAASSFSSSNNFVDPQRFSADGTLFVDGTGAVYNSSTFAPVGVLGLSPVDSAWIGGNVYTLSVSGSGTLLTIWGGPNYLSTGTTQLPGAPVRIFPLSSTEVLAITEQSTGPVLTVLNAAGAVVTQQVGTAQPFEQPLITQEPTSVATGTGTNASFTVVASGSGLSYQWYDASNFSTVLGTAATLQLTGVSQSQSGSYYVVVHGDGLQATSIDVGLTVTSPPIFSEQPSGGSVASGSGFTLLTGIPFNPTLPTPTYQWYLNGAPIAGATLYYYNSPPATAADAGTYTVVATNPYGSTTSNPAVITVTGTSQGPQITTQPSAQTVSSGASVQLSVAASGSPSPTYQWYLNGTPISGATSSTYSVASATTADSGSYTVVVTNSSGFTTSSAAVVTVNSPSQLPQITSQPSAQTVNSGASVQFSVAASGVPAPTFQWYFNGAAISGATSASYSIASAAGPQSGSYSVTVTNSVGGVSSAAVTLTVSPVTATSIVTAPSSQSVNAGANVTLQVAAAGASPLTFQWSFNGSVIAGATGSSYSIVGAQPANSGSYTVAVSGPGGLASAGAALAVSGATGAPAIQSQPQSQTIQLGSTVTFHVGSDGVVTSGSVNVRAASTTSFQWFLNGAPVSGATGATLVISGASYAQAGTYNCLVTNSAGAQLSGSANLSIVQSPNPGRLVNISCRSQVGTGGDIMIAGFAVGGQGTSGLLPVLIRSSGPAVAAFSVPGFLPDPSLQLFGSASSSTPIASDAGWKGAATISSSAAAVGAFPWTSTSSLDSAIVESLPAGPYTAQTSGASGDTGVALAEIYDATPSSAYVAGVSPRIVNISARVNVGKGGSELIAGFVIGGATSQTVLIRASGPALTAFSVSGVLPDPQLQLYAISSTTSLLQTRTAWGGDAQVKAAAASVGAFSWTDSTSSDSAILVTLAPGSYTANVSGASGDTGVALIEVYEVP